MNLILMQYKKFRLVNRTDRGKLKHTNIIAETAVLAQQFYMTLYPQRTLLQISFVEFVEPPKIVPLPLHNPERLANA